MDFKTRFIQTFCISLSFWVFQTSSTNNLTATPYVQTFFSHEGFDGMSFYPENNYTQDWLITSSLENYTITLELTHCTLETGNGKGICIHDLIYIYDGPDSNSTLLQETCCGVVHDPMVEGTGSQLYILFTTDETFVDTGFSINYILKNAPTTTLAVTMIPEYLKSIKSENDGRQHLILAVVISTLVASIVIVSVVIFLKKKQHSNLILHHNATISTEFKNQNSEAINGFSENVQNIDRIRTQGICKANHVLYYKSQHYEGSNKKIVGPIGGSDVFPSDKGMSTENRITNEALYSYVGDVDVQNKEKEATNPKSIKRISHLECSLDNNTVENQNGKTKFNIKLNNFNYCPEKYDKNNTLHRNESQNLTKRPSMSNVYGSDLRSSTAVEGNQLVLPPVETVERNNLNEGAGHRIPDIRRLSCHQFPLLVNGKSSNDE